MLELNEMKINTNFVNIITSKNQVSNQGLIECLFEVAELNGLSSSFVINNTNEFLRDCIRASKKFIDELIKIESEKTIL